MFECSTPDSKTKIIPCKTLFPNEKEEKMLILFYAKKLGPKIKERNE